MSTRTADYRDAVEHLPDGVTPPRCGNVEYAAADATSGVRERSIASRSAGGIGTREKPQAAVANPAAPPPPRETTRPPPDSAKSLSTRALFQLRHRLSSGGWANDLAFSIDGTLLAAAGEARQEWYGTLESDGLVHVWDSQSGAVRQRKVTARKMQYRSVAFSQDGRALFVAGESHTPGAENPIVTVSALDVETGKSDAALFTIDRAHVWRCRVRPDGRIVVIGAARLDSSTGSYSNCGKDLHFHDCPFPE